MPLEEILRFFADYIERELGIVYARENYFQLQNRLDEIVRLQGAGSIEALHAQAQSGIGGSFRQLLLDTATNNETSFFRDPKVFRAIENTILPALLPEGALLPHLSIWSAASSSGQEALSLAMSLTEWQKSRKRSLQFTITGSDISERILARAAAGRYSQLEVQRGLPSAMLVKYFTKDDKDRWQASPELMRHLAFRTQNLTAPLPSGVRYDLILCRNVLIYQNLERKAAILKRLHGALAPGGYLILGAAESLIGISDDFTSEVADGAVIYRRRDRGVAEQGGGAPTRALA